MEVGLTFGAVGDFISIALLIKDIALALDSAKGSSKSYADLAASLELLSDTIREVAGVYLSLSGSDEVRGIAARTVSRVRQLLDELEDEMKQHRALLSPNGLGRTSLKYVARKVRWKLVDEKYLQQKRSEVLNHCHCLKMVLAITAMQVPDFLAMWPR